MEISEDRLQRVVALLISKNKGDDPITMSEKIVERIREEMELADAGYGIRPLQIRKDPEPMEIDPDLTRKWSESRPKLEKVPPQERTTPGAPRASGGNLVVGPDDPEFATAMKMTEAERREAIRNQGATKSVRLSKVGQPLGVPAGPPTKYWAPETLIAETAKNTPKEFTFTPNGCDKDVEVLAVRDILSMYPIADMLRLTYTNPGVSGDRVDRDAGGEASAVFGLMAKEDLLFTEREFDWDAIMGKIVGQLKEMYAPKKKYLAGVDLPPSPMDHWKPSPDGMHASESSHWQRSGYSPSGSGMRELTTRDGHTYRVADPLGDTVNAVIAGNRKGNG